jgi:hypothetical protein
MQHRKRVYQPAAHGSQMVLARQDRQHFIATSSRGEQIHIHWRHVQINMAPSELLSIADFLERTTPRLKTNSLWGNALHCIIQDERDHVEVWLLGVGFYLTPTEFKQLVDLVYDGANSVRAIANYVQASDAEDEPLH